jgi:tRNA threonylcarbamoyl adenosine modification protein YeaZ
MITLALDASTYVGSVCVVRRGVILATREVAMRDQRRDHLMPAVQAALDECGIQVSALDRVVCGGGPGSFTSLRIAGAIAKGLAMATGYPLYAVSSLALMVGAVEPALRPGEYVAVLDALRGEYYAATCTVGEGGAVVDVGSLSVIGRDALEERERLGEVIIGEGHAVRSIPHARGTVRVEHLLERDGPVDLAMWEPDYGRVAEAQRRWEAAHGRAMPRA